MQQLTKILTFLLIAPTQEHSTGLSHPSNTDSIRHIAEDKFTTERCGIYDYRIDILRTKFVDAGIENRFSTRKHIKGAKQQIEKLKMAKEEILSSSRSLKKEMVPGSFAYKYYMSKCIANKQFYAAPCRDINPRDFLSGFFFDLYPEYEFLRIKKR